MKKKLKKLINLSKILENKEYIKDIPKIISHIEKIVRVLLYSKMVTKNEVNIRSNAFRTPPDIDEVSVIRLDYCIPDFCKKQGKKIQNQEKNNFQLNPYTGTFGVDKHFLL